jgi:flagellar protein FlgJ
VAIDGLAKAEVYTDLQGLADLRRGAHDNSPEALRGVARQFEALFTQMMLKSMREADESMADNDLFENDQTRLYRDMYDKQLSLEMSRGKGLGLGDMLVRQLQGSLGNAPAEAGPAQATTHRASRIAAPKPAAEAAVERTAFDSPESFVKGLWPAAMRAGSKLGVDPRALLAQAALETGWGKAVIRRPDGSSSCNLFNIKADSRWKGESAVKNTVEYRDGVARQEKAPFRAYDSYEQSFEDYVQFLQSQPRYQEAVTKVHDPAAFFGALQEAGYATDPAYARKVQAVLGHEVLAQTDSLKKPDGGTIS